MSWNLSCQAFVIFNGFLVYFFPVELPTKACATSGRDWQCQRPSQWTAGSWCHSVTFQCPAIRGLQHKVRALHVVCAHLFTFPLCVWLVVCVFACLKDDVWVHFTTVSGCWCVFVCLSEGWLFLFTVPLCVWLVGCVYLARVIVSVHWPYLCLSLGVCSCLSLKGDFFCESFCMRFCLVVGRGAWDGAFGSVLATEEADFHMPSVCVCVCVGGVYACLHVCLCACMCVCVCVRAEKRKRELVLDGKPCT